MLVIASGSTGAAAAADYVRRRKFRPTTPLARRRSSAIRSRATSSTAPFPPASITGQAHDRHRASRRCRTRKRSASSPAPMPSRSRILPKSSRGSKSAAASRWSSSNSTRRRRDFTAQLVSFARQRVEVVLILGSFTEAGFAIKQAPEKGLTNVHLRGRRLRREQRDHSDHRSRKTRKTYGAISTRPISRHRTTADGGLSQAARLKDTEALPQGRPNIYDLIGYGSTYVLAQVLKKTGRDLTWERLIDAWETHQGRQAVRSGRL